MIRKIVGATVVGGVLLIGPLAAFATAHPAHARAAVQLKDKCIVKQVGSLEITICVPT